MSVDIVEQTDVAARAEARLATQYRASSRLKALIACATAQCQQVEQLLFSIMLGYRLSTPPVGEQLDVLGRLVGQARESADDAEYRLRIAARIRSNFSSGSAEDLYTVFGILLPTETLAITPIYPAAFVLDVFGALDPDLVALYARFLADTKAAGVSGQGVYSLFDEAHTFLFSEVGDPDSATLGFADDSSTIGAHLAGTF